MEESKVKIKAYLLGGASCTVNGVNSPLLYSPTSKGAQLLLYLLYKYPEPQPKSKLLENLYADSESDPMGSFKVLLLRLRRMMAQELELSDKDCILLKNGLLSLSDSLEIRSDVQDFRELYQKSLTAVGEEKRKALEKLCRIYRGELLPMLATEPWVIYGNALLTEAYTRSVDELCRIYRQNKEYENAYRCYKRGLVYFPYSEDWSIGAIEVLTESGRIQEAQEEYETVRASMMELFGMYPSERLVKALEKIQIKKSQLKSGTGEENGEEPAGLQGAFYCTYPEFMSSYRILKRIAARENRSDILLMLTLTDDQGEPLSIKGEITPAIADLQTAIGGSLRKNDMFTRFSLNQMLIMLWNTQAEYVPLIMERIRGRFEEEEEICRHQITAQILDSADLPLPSEHSDARAGRSRGGKK